MAVLSFIRRSPFILPLACVATAAMMFVSEGSYWQSVDAMTELDQRQTTRMAIAGLAPGILDAQAGQRSYLLTDQAQHLAAYTAALRQTEDAFGMLDRHYQQNPQAMAALAQLRALAQARLAALDRAVQAHQAGQVQAAQALVRQDKGQAEMGEIRRIAAGLSAIEAASAEASRASLSRTLMLRRIGVAVLSAVCLLSLFFFLRQAATLKAREAELKRLAEDDHHRLEVEVRERTFELTELTQHLQTAREDERHRLARNLHDDLGSLLTSAKLDAARIRSRIATKAPDALELLGHLVGTLNDSVALGRRIIEDLHPSALVNLGLLPTLEILAREFTAQCGVAVVMALEPEPQALPPSAQLMVYRVVQEAFTNIVKYAQARQVWLAVRVRAGALEVTVRDDGVGFDAHARPGSSYGLLGMRYRVQAEGGRLLLTSSPAQGTQVQVVLPLQTPP